MHALRLLRLHSKWGGTHTHDQCCIQAQGGGHLCTKINVFLYGKYTEKVTPLALYTTLHTITKNTGGSRTHAPMGKWHVIIKGVATRLWVKVSDNFGYGWEDPFMQRWKTYSDENVVNGPFCQPTWKKWTWNLMSSWRRSWLFPRNTQERQKQASTVEKHVWHLWLHWFEVIKCQLKRHH